MRYLRFASLILACALPLAVEAADLPLAVAVQAAQQAVQSCKVAGYSVTVTVLDSDLSTRVILRADGAREATVQIAYRKAYTVVKMKMSSGDFGKTVPPQTTEPGAMPGPVNGDANLITWRGGLPIMIGQTMVGAMSVSGAPGGDKDEACVQAGLNKVKDRLK